MVGAEIYIVPCLAVVALSCGDAGSKLDVSHGASAADCSERSAAAPVGAAGAGMSNEVCPN